MTLKRNNMVGDRPLRGLSLMACLLLAMTAALADSRSPLELVVITVDDVVADMREHAAHYQAQPQALQTMVLDRVAPHFNFKRMAQLSMGRYWGQASDEQRGRIIDEFRTLLARTYSNSMFAFRDESISVVGEQQSGQRATVVRLKVSSSTASDVDLLLRMQRTGETWQVIDVVVDGVSLIITYRGTFADQISKHGIDGLIDYLHADNRQSVSP